MLLLTGIFLLALGLLSGGALVFGSFGGIDGGPGLTLWATFPILCIAGFAFVAVQARSAVVRQVSLVTSGLLLLLALSSIAALVLGAAAILPRPSTTAPLWFVLVVGAMLGSVGAASFGRPPADA